MGIDAARVGGLLTPVFIAFRSGSGTTVAVVRVDMLNAAVRPLARSQSRHSSLHAVAAVLLQRRVAARGRTGKGRRSPPKRPRENLEVVIE